MNFWQLWSWGCIVEVLTEMLRPILTYGILVKYVKHNICQYGCQNFRNYLYKQPPTPKLSKVHFDILNLINKNGPISIVFSGISFVFFSPIFAHLHNFRKWKDFCLLILHEKLFKNNHVAQIIWNFLNSWLGLLTNSTNFTNFTNLTDFNNFNIFNNFSNF